MDGLDSMFRALGNSIRRAILLRLALGETTVNALCESFDISAPAISNHVQILEKVSLLTRRQQGKQHLLRLTPEALDHTKAWIDFIRRA